MGDLGQIDAVSAVETRLSELELGEARFDRALLARALDALPEHLDEQELFDALMDDGYVRASRARGLVCVADTLPALDEVYADVGEEVWREPHVLGWLLQAFHTPRRLASFGEHHKNEAKHSGSTISTQLYTPRWVADALVDAALGPGAAGAPPEVCDPAVGGGQMLLAALDAMVTRWPERSGAELMACLHGVELDERAVKATQLGLELRARELFGEDEDWAALIRPRIYAADGLYEPRSRRFDLVLANPPYMGTRSMLPELKATLKKDWEPFHSDLYLAFMRRCVELSRGSVGVLVQQTVWFLSRFKKAREWMLEHTDTTHFLHLGPRLFGSLSGEKASVVASVHRVGADESAGCEFFDLRDGSSQEKRAEYMRVSEREPAARTQQLSSFDAIPGAPLAHWLVDEWRQMFARCTRLGDLVEVPGAQNKTGRNSEYVRPWAEVDASEINPTEGLWGARADTALSPRWFFYSKGGRFAPWWGNWGSVIDWSEQARAFYKDNPTSNLLDASYWLRPGLCYTDFGGRSFNARWMPAGCLFDMAGPAILSKLDDPEEAREQLLMVLALLNSSPTRVMLNALNPSLHYQVRDVRALPVPDLTRAQQRELAGHARALVEMTRAVHLVIEGDPLHAPRLGKRGVDRAALLIGEIERTWGELDAYVLGLYGREEERASMPAVLHHEFAALTARARTRRARK